MNQHFVHWLHFHHRLRPDQVRPASTPGYWKIIEPCGGKAGGCRQPVHSYLFMDGPMNHTVYYRDPDRDEHGRFADPFRTWKQAVKEAVLSD